MEWPPTRKVEGTTSLGSAESLAECVQAAVREVEVVDVHTHLFPESHEELCSWGVDDLLCYHYLVSEFFMVAPASISYDEFFGKSKEEQANLIWKFLFVERVPCSEAAIGVCTTLKCLGLENFLQRRDLDGIRSWFAEQSPEEHIENVFRIAVVLPVDRARLDQR